MTLFSGLLKAVEGVEEAQRAFCEVIRQMDLVQLPREDAWFPLGAVLSKASKSKWFSDNNCLFELA